MIESYFEKNVARRRKDNVHIERDTISRLTTETQKK